MVGLGSGKIPSSRLNRVNRWRRSSRRFRLSLAGLGSTDYRVHDRFGICEDGGGAPGCSHGSDVSRLSRDNCIFSNCKFAIIASYRCEIGAPRAGPFVFEGVGDADLDLIKQAEQGVRDGRRRFLRVKMANDAPTLTLPARGGGRGSPPISTAA